MDETLLEDEIEAIINRAKKEDEHAMMIAKAKLFTLRRLQLMSDVRFAQVMNEIQENEDNKLAKSDEHKYLSEEVHRSSDS